MKPLDRDLVLDLARNHEVLVTVEEGAIGGFGSHVLHCLAEAGLLDRGLKVRSMVLPDVFIDHGQPHQMYELAGLNASAIAKTALAALGDASEEPYRAVSAAPISSPHLGDDHPGDFARRRPEPPRLDALPDDEARQARGDLTRALQPAKVRARPRATDRTSRRAECSRLPGSQAARER